MESLRSMTGTADQKTEKRENGADEEVSLQQLYLTENFALPFYFGYRQKFPFEIQKETYSEHEAKEKASQNYQKVRRLILHDTEIYQKKDFKYRRIMLQ